MASSQGQDIICCQLSPNPVEHHCNLCHVDLCLSCIPKHMADKSKEHEIVGYTSRKQDSFSLAFCHIHKNNRCETFCQDCNIPICIQCLIGSHKKHEFTDINDILQEYKKQIIYDTEELENKAVPKYRNINLSKVTTGFDKVVSAIKEQEEEIWKAVHEISIQLTDEVVVQKKEAISKYKENQSLAEKEVNQIVKENKYIIRSNDATAIIHYQSRNRDFRKGPELPSLSCPKLLPGIIKKDQIAAMFGFLQTEQNLVKKPGMLKMMDDPAIFRTIQSSFGGWRRLWRVQCVGSESILISGGDSTIKQIDRTGSILKTIKTNDNVWALTINSQQDPLFSTMHYKSTDIYQYNDGIVKILISIHDWFPVGLWYSGKGDLLVSMRSMDTNQSRVVRYSGMTEKQKIQYDSEGQPLFSTGVVKTVILLTENGNGDICAADCYGKMVVVVDSFGRLRFKYTGNLSKQSKYTEFSPSHIAADVSTQILISDKSNNIVHIIDSDGNFVRYIVCPCDGGLSIDTDCNLVIGDKDTGKIQFIKYLE
ncbi:E3 ubiquitin-protein ligase TRIM71-like [Saccostrea cucullata]|uniref:E3 ubiquitin-protein ligase TRIM71-like n=1 Tax=Saccostrea cuccullata TaxID=36930 RepID=UPI002ED57F48